MAPQVLGSGGKCSTVFLAVPGGRQLAVGGISDPVLTAGPDILWEQDQGTQGWGKYVEGRVSHMTRALGVVALRL